MARILVVDDDKDILLLTKELLSSLEHIVYTAESAATAFDIVNSQALDLVITDANMPTTNGFDLAKTIKKNPRTRSLPIALLTARKERKDIELALQIGISDYIVKPIDPMIFLQKVQSIFEKNPPQVIAQYLFDDNDELTHSQLALDVKLKSVSELGVQILSKQQVAENQRVSFYCKIFEQIGFKSSPPMKVLSCTRSPNPEYPWLVRVTFIGAKDSEMQKIRAWITQTTLKHRRAS